MNRRFDIPLVLILATCAILELLLNRIGLNLVSSEPWLRELPGFAFVDVTGLFTYYLTSILAFVVLTWALVVLIRDQGLLDVPDRVAVTIAAALFLPLAGGAILFELPQQMAPHLNTSFGILLLVLVVAFMRKPAQLRARIGILYLTAPILLHVYWLLTQQVPGAMPEGSYRELPNQLFRSAEHLVVVGAFAAFLFFAPFPRLSSLLDPVALGVTIGVTAALGLLARFSYLRASQAAYYGLGVNLPPPSAVGMMHLAALFFFTLTVTALLRRPGPERATGVGLALIGSSGFHLQAPYQLMLTLVGLLQIMRAAMESRRVGSLEHEPRRAVITAAQWQQYLNRLASACAEPPESGHVVTLENDGQQIGNVRGSRQGLPFNLRLLHREGLVDRLELTVGEPPREPAPISTNRRRELRGRRVSDRSSGPRVKLGDQLLDWLFVCHGEPSQAGPLLAEGVAPQKIEELIHGWLGVWPGEGLHYIARPGADGWPVPLAEIAFAVDDADTEQVCTLVDLLSEIARRADVHA